MLNTTEKNTKGWILKSDLPESEILPSIKLSGTDSPDIHETRGSLECQHHLQDPFLPHEDSLWPRSNTQGH